MGRHSAPSASAGTATLERPPSGPSRRARHAAAPAMPAELGNLALLERVPAHEPPPPLVLVAGPAPVAVEPPATPSAPPTLTLVSAPAATHVPAHHGAPAPLPVRLLADVAGWAGFAVAVVWVVVLSAGHGLASATAWAGSLLGLMLAAVGLLALVCRPQRTPGGPRAGED